MAYLKTLIKTLFLSFSLILFLSFLDTLLYYFNLIPKGVYVAIELITPIFSIFIGAYFMGKKATKKGWLEGMKIGGLILLIFLFIESFQDNIFTLKLMFYDAILLFTSSVGGMTGINRKKPS